MLLERTIWHLGIYWENEQNFIHETFFFLIPALQEKSQEDL